MYKLVILDYDGTLVGQSGVVTDRVKAAIKKTVQKDVKVSISTGRSAYSVIDIIKELNLDLPHVFLAGALVYNPIKDLVILEDPIEKSAALEIANFSLEQNVYLEVSSGKEKTLYYNIEDTTMVQRRLRLTAEPVQIVDIAKFAEQNNILCMRFFLTDEEKKKTFFQLKNKLSEKINFQIGYPFAEPELEVVNMTSLEVSKVSALRHLCQYLKIEPHETIAIGDSPIDLPLIENVGMGIAMGNSSQKVKSKAKWVTTDVEKDGVAVALEKFTI